MSGQAEEPIHIVVNTSARSTSKMWWRQASQGTGHLSRIQAPEKLPVFDVVVSKHASAVSCSYISQFQRFVDTSAVHPFPDAVMHRGVARHG